MPLFPDGLDIRSLTLTFKIIRVNLAQIRSAVPEIFHTQAKNTD